MGFRKFDAREHRTRSVSDYPQVSIGKSRIYLNAVAAEKFGEHVNKVEILFDDEEHQLGIKAADDDDITAFPLAKNSKYKGLNINSQSVINGIMGKGYNETRKYEAEWNEEEQMLILNLNKPK